MSSTPSRQFLQLQPGQIVHADGAWLSVVRGRVWVTQAGDPDDHFLSGGQAMRLAPGARALVEADGAAQVALVPAPAWWERWSALATQWAFRPARPCLPPP
jgi:hypothetical protein